VEAVLALYQERPKVPVRGPNGISARTGVPPATVYNIIHKSGIMPDRSHPVGGREAARERQLEQERLLAELDGWKANTKRLERQVKALEGEVERLLASLAREQANFDFVLRNGPATAVPTPANGTRASARTTQRKAG
jgi:hypothetical protein